MDNKIKSKTRLAAIQLIAQQLINHQDIDIIKDDFDKNYRNTVIEEGEEKIQYNVNFLSKLINFYKTIKFNNISIEINNLIEFKRTFEKWDTINQAIILAAISEIRNSEKDKMKIMQRSSLSSVQRSGTAGVTSWSASCCSTNPRLPSRSQHPNWPRHSNSRHADVPTTMA